MIRNYTRVCKFTQGFSDRCAQMKKRIVVGFIAVNSLLITLLFYENLGGLVMKRTYPKRTEFARVNLSNGSANSGKTIRSFSTQAAPTALERYGLANTYLVKALRQPHPLYNFTITPRTMEDRVFSSPATFQKKWSMIILVKSEISNFARRMAVRETWGSIKYFDGMAMETVFVIASPRNDQGLELLTSEAEKYTDILAFEGDDQYDKLFHKILAGMQWACDKLPLDWLVASSDDDVALHVKRFQIWISQILTQKKRGNTTLQNATYNLPIYCAYRLGRKSRPLRSRASKWFVTMSEYPPSVYPPYCLGAFFVMPLKTASQILNTSRFYPGFKIDDVWITGVLRLLVENANFFSHLGCVESFQVSDGGNAVSHVWDIDHRKDNFSVPDTLRELWKKWQVTEEAKKYFVKKGRVQR